MAIKASIRTDVSGYAVAKPPFEDSNGHTVPSYRAGDTVYHSRLTEQAVCTGPISNLASEILQGFPDTHNHADHKQITLYM